MFNKFRKKIEEELAEKVDQVNRGVRKTVERVNPFDEESKQKRAAKKLEEFASRTYGMTNEARNQLSKTDKRAGEGDWQIIGDNSTAKAGGMAGGIYDPNINQIQVADEDGMGGANVFRHEALHRLWDTMDNESRQQFQSLIESQENADPELKSFLDFKLNGYKDSRNINEVHSFIPEFYDRDKNFSFEDGTFSNRKMPDELRKHYSKYYNPSRKRERDEIAEEIMKMTGKRPYKSMRL